jgi:hypothetical protein
MMAKEFNTTIERTQLIQEGNNTGTSSLKIKILY